MNHHWTNDVCSRCGISRHGYGGGRTGGLDYRDATGHVIGTRAPACLRRWGGGGAQVAQLTAQRDEARAGLTSVRGRLVKAPLAEARRLTSEDWCGEQLLDSGLVCGQPKGHAQIIPGAHKVMSDVQALALVDLADAIDAVLPLLDAALSPATGTAGGEGSRVMSECCCGLCGGAVQIAESEVCRVCGRVTSALAGDPGKWPLSLWVEGVEPGTTVTFCTSCVQESLAEVKRLTLECAHFRATSTGKVSAVLYEAAVAEQVARAEAAELTIRDLRAEIARLRDAEKRLGKDK